jgi:transposase
VNQITTIGMDLAKQVCHVVGFDSDRREVFKKQLRRHQVAKFFAKHSQCTVAMEACAGAHEWGRQLEAMGHQVKLVSPKFVKTFVDGNKNDYIDARAIAEASWSPRLRPVPVKTRAQQEWQALHRFREARIRQRTALCNQARGLLAEYGMVLPQGISALRRRIPVLLEDAENGLGALDREMLAAVYEQLAQLDQQIARFDRLINQQARQDPALQALQTVPGFGPIVASAFRGHVGNGTAFRRGRDVAASLGIVPAQHTTGGKARLLGISKRGDRYLRAKLIHGARSVVRQAANKDDPLSRWIRRVEAARGRNKAVVALANKLARIGWAVLRHDTVYDPGRPFAA